MNKINIEFIQGKRNLRADKIAKYAETKKISKTEAAIFIDFNAPKTTNRKMLNQAGYSLKQVKATNCLKVIDALKMIGVNVIGYRDMDKKTLGRILTKVINEEINECWGGPDCQEFIDITPQNI
jgi:hypothetical protein